MYELSHEERRARRDEALNAFFATNAAWVDAHIPSRLRAPAEAFWMTEGFHPDDLVLELDAWRMEVVCHYDPDVRSTSPGSLILTGPAGVGKTIAALAVALNTMHAIATSLVYVKASEMFAALRPGGATPENPSEYQSAKLLVLDDLGRSRRTDFTDEMLFAVIDARWENERPTLVTTNLLPHQIEPAVGQAVFSRLMDRVTVLHIGGADQRRA